MSEVRLIDGNVAREVITDLAGKVGTKAAYAAIWKCARVIDSAPTITPESLGYHKVVHGSWLADAEESGTGIVTRYYCSECGRCIGRKGDMEKAPYCNCGARMDGEEQPASKTAGWPEWKLRAALSNYGLRKAMESEP